MKNFAALPFLLLLLLTALPSLAAELIEVRVVGRGTDSELALQDAFRQATRQVFGTFILGHTVTKNAALVEDQVSTISQGFIDSCKILNESTVEGLVLMDTQVSLTKTRVKQQAALMGHPDWDEQLAALSTIPQIQEKRQMEARALKALIPDSTQFVRQAFRFDLAGLETNDVGPDYISGHLLVRVSKNDLFWQQYEQLLTAMACTDGTTVVEGQIRSPAELLPYFAMHGKRDWFPRATPAIPGADNYLIDRRPGSTFFGLGIVDGIRVHSSHTPMLPTRLLAVELGIGDQTTTIGILRNAVLLNTAPKDLAKWRSVGHKGPVQLTGITGVDWSLVSGGVYSRPDDGFKARGYEGDLALVVTKDTFLLKLPFRVQSLLKLRTLLTQPILCSVLNESGISIPRYRFVEDRSSFFSEI